MISGYLTIIALGTVLLLLPFSTTHGISVIDSLFTATSSLCVTGLIVKDTAVDFTIWGKLIILLLIQVGGLGYMTLSTSFFFFLGKRVGLRDRLLFKESLNLFTYDNLMRFAWRILRITLVVELAGAVLLYFSFAKKFTTFEAIGHAVFHSVSAFCNAGFSTFSENLSYFSDSWSVPLIVSILLLTGGLGFIVISDIFYVFIKKAKKNISLHSKIVLRTTAILIVTGTIFILFYEGTKSLQNYSWAQKIIHSFFHAITPRTAGFNTVNISLFSPLTIVIIILFMFIGASPGGTGGGIKTATFATLLIWIKELLLGRYGNDITVMKRRIPVEQAMRAFLLMFISVFAIFVAFFLIMLIDKPPAFRLIFELFSAFGTVGLSLGSATNSNCSFVHDLSFFGKFMVILMMLIGRVGVLTISSALIRPRSLDYSYSEESILIG